MSTDLTFPKLAKVAVEGFKLLQDSGQISPSELRLTNLQLINDSVLVASIIPSVSDSIGVKIEACTVMCFMVSFFNGEFALPPNVTTLGVRAFSNEGEEIMYVLSSLDIARCCSEGRPIEWLTNSIFQDNTPEQRRARAKLLVSRIEIGLRRLVSKRLRTHYGTNWWPTAVPQHIRESAGRDAKREIGTVSNGDKLIEYTYLPHLKEIVLNQWNFFQDVFRDSGKFGRALDDLNSIRRPEAHNRPLSDSQIRQLEGLYRLLAGAMTEVDNDTVPSFLVENWRQRLATIIQETSESIPKMLETDRRNPGLVRRKFDEYVDALEAALVRINSVVVPTGKEELHSQLEEEWADLCNAVRRMQQAVDSDNFVEVAAAAVQHEQAFARLRCFTTKYLMSELGG